MTNARTRLKWLLFPGMNLHARLRYRLFPGRFTSPEGQTRWRFLDAGCGNGMLTYQAYLKGYDAIGINFSPTETERCRQLFNAFLDLPEKRLSFRVGNLHDLHKQDLLFDEAVCAEVIEHIRDDAHICKQLYESLRPGGILHICTPNAEHPYNLTFPLDLNEGGGHVRPGYTTATLSQLLTDNGFQIIHHGGLGGPIRQFFNARIKSVQERFGAVWGFPLFLVSIVFTWLDPQDPKCPFSIYIKAQRPLHDRGQE